MYLKPSSRSVIVAIIALALVGAGRAQTQQGRTR